MKTNLKNKPTAIKGKRAHSLTPFGYEVNKWFEEFERELREIMASPEPLTDVRWFIKKEILGE